MTGPFLAKVARKQLELGLLLSTVLIAAGCAAPKPTLTSAPKAPSATPAAFAAVDQDEVLFSDLYKQGGLGNSIIVQTPPGKTLVIDSGIYELNGKDLVVYAATSTVRGKVTIRQFVLGTTSVSPPSDVPPVPQPVGGYEEPGTQGTMGRQGMRGATVDVSTLTPERSPSTPVVS